MTALSQRRLFLIEAFDLISNATILGAFYGIAFTLYCLCARLSYLQLQEPDKRRQARFTLSYISLTIFCVAAYLVLGTRMGQLAYINHADFSGGPLGYESSYNPTTTSYQMAGGIFSLIVRASTAAIQIWRLWTIWSGTRYAGAVIILPLLLLLCCMALDILANIVTALLPVDQLGITPQSADVMETASYAVVSTFTTLVTGLITARLLLVRRRHIRIMGTLDTSTPYMSIVAMLVESYALESTWSVAAAISAGLRSPSFYLFLANDSAVKVIAYFLVIYRVSTGRGWTRDTGCKLTSLQWNHGAQTATDETSSICSQAPAVGVVSAVGPLPISQPGSTV